MSDLFKKLNVLIKANLNEITSRDDAHPGRNLGGDVKALRARVSDAVQYEAQIKAQIRQFEDEAARWDHQADEAITQGKDDGARYAIEQMRRAEQRVTMAQADLREHQRVTQDLIQRVNALDAAVAEARRAESAEAARLPDLGSVLRETRERIASLGEAAAAQQELQTSESHEGAIDDDLERRRQRLSKR